MRKFTIRTFRCPTVSGQEWVRWWPQLCGVTQLVSASQACRDREGQSKGEKGRGKEKGKRKWLGDNLPSSFSSLNWTLFLIKLFLNRNGIQMILHLGDFQRHSPSNYLCWGRPKCSSLPNVFEPASLIPGIAFSWTSERCRQSLLSSSSCLPGTNRCP